MKEHYKMTVFTPTYNRAYILGNLYASLQHQSWRDFEWLIVDDGSCDDTAQVVECWQQEGNDFPIRYFRKENGGKCSAINYALDRAQGELFFTVDSDDYLTEDALEKIVSWEAALPAGKKYCAVAGNLGTAPDHTPNHLFEGEFFEGTLLDRYGCVDGERALAFYTDVHKKYRYPVFDGEKFMTEAVVWNRMAHDGYKTRFYNDIIWIYEYKEDGLTKAGIKLFLGNPRGYGLWMREKVEFLHISSKEKWKMYYSFVCDLSENLSIAEMAEYIGAPRAVIWALWGVHRIKYSIRK